MTYKEKMIKDNPLIPSDFVIFSCPGAYYNRAPHADNEYCPHRNGNRTTCLECWEQEIPESKPEQYNSELVLHEVKIPDQEPVEKSIIDVKKVATRVTKVYAAFRDAGLNHAESIEFTKIVIAEELRHEMS